MQELISAKFALENLYNKTNVVFIDSTFHLPNSGRNALEEFNTCHIPNARFFDINKISEQSSNLPHMLPSESFFSKMVGKLGINNDDTVVAYDNSIFFSSARAWWMFKIFGHKNLKIIDGGFKAWKDQGGPLESKKNVFKNTTYISQKVNYKLYDNLDNIMEDLNNYRNKVIIDARGEERFLGQVEEPRPKVRSGHIPSSLNIPISSLIDKKTNCFKSTSEINQIFIDIGITNKDAELVMTCGSGVTACGLAIAANSLGFKNVKVYDGSWSEWGANPKTPIEL